jgi:glycosyltransferase involved in cell wall biosynthesis
LKKIKGEKKVTNKKNVLVWSTTPTVASGFGRQVSIILDELFKTGGYEFTIMGKDYHGEAHNLPYKIFPIYDLNSTGTPGSEAQALAMSAQKGMSGIQYVVSELMTGKYDALFVYQDMFLTTQLSAVIGNVKQTLAQSAINKDFKIICYYTVDGKAFVENLRLGQKADVVVVPNGFCKDKVSEFLSFEPKVIPHGIESIFKPINENDRNHFRKEFFGDLSDKFIVGYLNNAGNPRKNILGLLEGWKIFIREHPDSYLYLHTNVSRGLTRSIKDLGIQNSIIHSNIDFQFGLPLDEYALLVGSLDATINTSFGEAWGLTITESILAKVPVVMPPNVAMSKVFERFTSQPELSGRMQSFDTTGLFDSISPQSLSDRLCKIRGLCGSEELERILEAGRNFVLTNYSVPRVGKQWVKVFNETLKSEDVGDTKKIVLFAQYESAGDVLLATQTFQGIKKKHEGFKLHVMTSKPFMDILEGNPYIDKLIPWDGNLLKKYPVVYKPHVDRIRTGNWGAGEFSLSELYSRLCGVENNSMYMNTKRPEGVELPNRYIVTHSSGGHPMRVFKGFGVSFKTFFDEINEEIPVFQIGGEGDLKIKNAIDLRGKLSFQETGWVIKGATLFVGVDSFPHHCAAAFGVPQVAIFSCASPNKTASPSMLGTAITPDWIRNCPLIGGCHGNNRNCKVYCIDTINPVDVGHAITRAFIEASEVKKLKKLEARGKLLAETEVSAGVVVPSEKDNNFF